MAEKRTKTNQKMRRKLSRAQIQEILERNLNLYKDEASFIPYLVELAIYLLEFEYNWENSGAEPPNELPPHPDDLEPVDGVVEKGNAKIFHKLIDTAAGASAKRDCPHCGVSMGSEELTCPNCHNLTR